MHKKMILCIRGICAKLSGPFSLLERSQCRNFRSLSCLDSVVRANPARVPAHANFKDFHFHFARLGTYASVRNGSAYCPALINAAATAKKTREHVLVVCQRNNSTDKQTQDTTTSAGDKKSLVEARESPYAHLTVGQKVKEAGKDASYVVVIIVGIAVTGLMFFMIGRELLSSQSPSGVYGDALSKCQNNIEVAAALGEPIKGYGETSRRGRRRHVSHTEFDVQGVPHMRMRFYIEGPYKKATVHVEVQKGDSGKYEYRYLVVETEGYPHRTFILEDNR